ncbi:hypothetical protein CALVIDRAFT_134093 [Calocera viscosa TUFC12733]|uniref:Uncharacterized protein n=1 Tax=Calocera viscosa (strain TUFC12733) TaxID=1330018 RepID=A0A167LWT4_CALVF|nr:hypothetical protein CALVIDRAFT_134093 [Calocera viscosa TUFC12733]
MDDQYSHRNNKKLRGVYRRIYGEQSTELARNTFLPVLDFLDLRSVRSFIPSYLPEEEFDLAVSMVLPTIREEAQAFCARMRSDLVRLWCRGNKYSRPAEEDDEWRSEFLSLAAVVFIPKGHEDCGSLIHYSTLFKRDIFLSAAFPARYDDSPEAHPTLSENWVDYLAGISYSHDHFQAMRKTLQTYFSDWDTTSLSDLDAQEGWKDKFYDIFDSR